MNIKGLNIVLVNADAPAAAGVSEYLEANGAVVTKAAGKAAEAEACAAQLADKPVDALVYILPELGVRAAFADIEDEKWMECMADGVTVPFIYTKALVPAMKKQNKGSIVYVGAAAAHRVVRNDAATSAFSSGLTGLMHCVAPECGSRNVRCNVICTDIGYYDGCGYDIAGLNPLGREGTSEELAKTIAFLVSDDSSYINGHELRVEGGLLLR